MKEPKTEAKTGTAEPVASTDLFGILRYVANEAQKNPGDSVKDIVNEALDQHGVGYHAEWSDDDEQPISILPNTKISHEAERK
jgi:hypothetical protein